MDRDALSPAPLPSGVTVGPVIAVEPDYETAPQSRSRVWFALRRNPAFWIGLVGALLIVGAAILAPILAPHPPDLQFRQDGLGPTGDPVGPSAKFPLGTDKLGRDYLSRLLFGARTSLTVGIGANLLATLIGVTVGAVAGYAGNPDVVVRVPGSNREIHVRFPVETVLMRITDGVLAFPALLLAIALVAIIGPSLVLVAIVIAAVLWTGIARIVYSQMRVVRESDFVLAARAVGVSGARILWRHVMPHLFSVIVVYATLGIATTVLFEATLSFLGVGVPPPAPSWGGMIFEHVGYYRTDPRVVILPGLAIMATILAFNLLGDALADALDPQQWA